MTTKLVIDRSRWLRGEGSTGSFLRAPGNGRMCCLGFFAVACGYDETELIGRQTPEDMMREHERQSKWPEWLAYFDEDSDRIETLEATDLMAVNDSEHIKESDREERIARMFRCQGIEVEFIDGPEQVSP